MSKEGRGIFCEHRLFLEIQETVCPKGVSQEGRRRTGREEKGKKFRREIFGTSEIAEYHSKETAKQFRNSFHSFFEIRAVNKGTGCP